MRLSELDSSGRWFAVHFLELVDMSLLARTKDPAFGSLLASIVVGWSILTQMYRLMGIVSIYGDVTLGSLMRHVA